MGATKEMFEEMRQEDFQNQEYYNLIGRLNNKEETLSYSSLKKFAESPRHFIQYKMNKDYKQTESQLFGSICDMKLTEPYKFSYTYAVVEATPSTDNQINFCLNIANGLTPEEAKKISKPRGDANELFLHYEKYINAVKNNKKIINTDLDEQTTKIVENLKQSEIVMQYVDSCNAFQVKKAFDYNGWKINSILDGEGNNLILEFKYASKCDIESFERDIKKYKYYLQAGIYSLFNQGISEYIFIVFDKNLNFSVVKLDYSYISYGIREFEYLINKLEDCINNNRWKESYNFFDVKKATIYKPKWAKGFDTDPIEID